MSSADQEIEDEEAHFASVVAAFRNYTAHSISANNRRRKDFFRLPKDDQDVLEKIGYKTRLRSVDKAVLVNSKFLDAIVANTEIFSQQPETDHRAPEPSHTHPHSDPYPDDHDRDGHSHSHTHGGSHTHSHDSSDHGTNETDMDKVRSTLKQLVRDWSEEGKGEREACYTPMIDALTKHFSNVLPDERGNIRVLVPGAGLGRLAYDIAKLGFTCQGNEFSLFMLLTSSFILNRTESVNQHVLHPYIHSFSNIPEASALLREIRIPDVLPSDLPEGSNFSMVAGDFEEIYGNPDKDNEHLDQWDAIVTCFFIDTAKNIVNYLRTFHRILAPGGIWINLGPMLWHWENSGTDPSIELDLEQVKALVEEIGFEVRDEKTIDTTYTNNTQSMLAYTYHSAMWAAVKK